MGFFSGLDAEKYDRQYSDRELIRRISAYFIPHRKTLLIIAGLIVLMSAAGSLQPVIVARGIDAIGGTPSLSSVLLIAGAVLVIGVVRWTANWMRRRLMIRAVADTILKLASDGFDAAADHDLSFYDQYSSGKVVSRITTDTRDFGQLVSLTTEVVAMLLEAGILGAVLLTIEWRLALYVYLIIPVVFFVSVGYRRLARRVTRDGMRAMAEVNSTIKETVSGIAIAKNFRQEVSIFGDFDRVNKTSYRMNVRRGLVLTIVFPTLNTIGGLATALLVYTGGMSVAQGIITAGSWYLFLLSLDAFLFPIMALSSFMTQVQTGLAAAERVFALIDADPAVTQIEQRVVPKLRGEIEFAHLSFRYRDAEGILEDFNLHIRPGENLALVGHTGAGKSSIARLIARFYEFQQGKLLVDGMDIRNFDLHEYRKQLGVVSQTPFLFSGTVAENIRYAKPDVSNAEIVELSQKVGNGEWLETLASGLQTEVGERGVSLSMGQRQMVSLLRVLIQRPAIFILDEATASIDPFTEWQIQQALKLVLECSTSILIAHRLSTVKSADRIIVMREGKIIEEGNHEGLLAQKGHYAELYNTYFRHQSLAYVEEVGALLRGAQPMTLRGKQ
ncbi:MAG TPA: ABC transporter ATP-binding protein [Levilinea sp.]|nr:ABC transporter ATP-binding protein [Levilinea sp.]